MIPKKIAIVGPESTGKSVLAQQLAQHFSCMFVPEVSREYLATIGLNYSPTDVLNIAKLQLEKEQELFEIAKKEKHLFLFSDTEWICIKIWMEFYGWSVPKWLIEGIEKQDYIHYFLMDIDLPWQPDPLRANKNDREVLFSRFLEELNAFKKKFSIIKGVENKRFINSLRKIYHL